MNLPTGPGPSQAARAAADRPAALRARILAATAAALTAGACGYGLNKGDKSSGDTSPGKITAGCVQGSLYNGLSGEHLAVPPPDFKQGVHLLVGDRILRAQPRIFDQANPELNPVLIGDFFNCEVPVDASLPIFAWVDGFLPFESRIEIDSTKRPMANAATNDLIRPVPIDTINIRVYPLGTQTKDLKFVVTHAGARLPGATVQIRPTGANYLDLMDPSNFLAPIDARMQTISVTTDGQGEALFPATELMLGGRYRYAVLPPLTGTDDTVAADGSGSFVVGLRTVPGTTDPYEVDVNLTHAQSALQVLSTSIDSSDYDPRGAITYVFNRPIELVPGSLDGLVAALSGANGAKLAVNQASNDASEQVSVAVKGEMLTLTPIFETKPEAQPDPHREPGLKVTYSGVFVRPAASPGNATPLAIGSSTVSFYGGVIETPVAKLLTVTQGDKQTGPVSAPLTQSIIIKLTDQFGNGLENQTVSFTAAGSDGSTVRKDDAAGSGATTAAIATDDVGLVKVTWYLGTTAGDKTLIVTSAGVDPLAVKATATP